MFKKKKENNLIQTDVWDLSKAKDKTRIFELDFFRGSAIIIMCLYHMAYDFAHLTSTSPFYGGLFSIFKPINPETFTEPSFIQGMQELGINVFYKFIPTGGPLEIMFAILFMVICGISCSFSRSNYYRGVKLFMVGALMSIGVDLFSMLTGTSIHIYLGIIQSLAIAILFYSIVDYFIDDYKIDIFVALVLTLVLIGTYISESTNGLTILQLPSGFQSNAVWEERYSLLLGYTRVGVDYFSPVLTSTFVFLGGAFGKVFYKNRKSPLPQNFNQKWASPILFCGKHSLIIYILHQPLIILILWAILAPFGYTCL